MNNLQRSVLPAAPAEVIESPTSPAVAVVIPTPVTAPRSRSVNRGWWQAFRQNRLGYYSFILFAAIYAFALAAELVSNDRPLVVRYQGEWYFPLFKDYPEAIFGGDLPIYADYLDPFIREQFEQPGNFALYPLNPYRFDTLAYYADSEHHPGRPSADNWLGTDTIGHDIAARVLYGFRISVTFALALTAAGTVLGILLGAVQGYFAGRIDLFAQRLIEIWGSMPELYLLILFASLFQPSFLILFVLMALFGWVGTSDYVRAEFLRNRQMEYVRASKALGLSNLQIMWRHILPNSLTPVITFLPFRISAGIMALASLDFLGLGVTTAPSLGQMLRQGKENLDAWWISASAFVVLVLTLLLLTLIGEGLRRALDTRAAERREVR